MDLGFPIKIVKYGAPKTSEGFGPCEFNGKHFSLVKPNKDKGFEPRVLGDPYFLWRDTPFEDQIYVGLANQLLTHMFAGKEIVYSHDPDSRNGRLQRSGVRRHFRQKVFPVFQDNKQAMAYGLYLIGIGELENTLNYDAAIRFTESECGIHSTTRVGVRFFNYDSLLERMKLAREDVELSRTLEKVFNGEVEIQQAERILKNNSIFAYFGEKGLEIDCVKDHDLSVPVRRVKVAERILRITSKSDE